MGDVKEGNIDLTSIEIDSEAGRQTRQPKRRFVGRKARDSKNLEETITTTQGNSDASKTDALQSGRSTRRAATALNTIPKELLEDSDINAAIGLLPANYNFEIHKTIHRIRQAQSKRVALQFPEGLLLFATTISDIITRFCPMTETLIMGDVTYGACCVDDFTARALECDLLVHYAHSCLIPVDVTEIKTLYVFVDISIDVEHLVKSIAENFQPGKRIAMVGTIQFNATIHGVKPQLESLGYDIFVPQIRPLSKGEILGCTAPVLSQTPSGKPKETQTDADLLIYLGDGRFHLESAMIQNPSIPAYRYDPYSRRLTKEEYGHEELYEVRSQAVLAARKARKWGLILGSLGRQGNPHTIEMIQKLLTDRGTPWITILLSEIFPGKLALMDNVEAWVQVACPRLSIDWGYAFPRPLLSPYEALVALKVEEGPWLRGIDGRESQPGTYMMNFYAANGLGRTKGSKRLITIEATV